MEPRTYKGDTRERARRRERNRKWNSLGLGDATGKSERGRKFTEHRGLDAFVAIKVFSRYRRMGIIPGWGVTRMKALAKLAGRTPEEIGAMVALTPYETRVSMQRNRFSPPVSLLLATLEAIYREDKLGILAEPLIPLFFFDAFDAHKAKQSEPAQPTV